MERLLLSDQTLGLGDVLGHAGLGHEIVSSPSWSDLRDIIESSTGAESREELRAVVVLPPSETAGHTVDEIARDLDAWKASRSVSLVLVVTDEALGTDAHVAHAGLAAASVALARSVAIYRGTAMRVNVILCSSTLFGVENAQRGPLRSATVEDVAHAADFLTGRQAGYINGQVLYVNGGRQLFSSLSA